MAFQLDSRIPLGSEGPQPFNGLAQLGQIRAQQQDQQIRNAQLQEHQAKVQAAQVDANELAAYKGIIGNPDLTPDTFLEQVKLKAPGQYEGAVKRRDEHLKAAADYKEQTQKAAASSKIWISGHLDDIAASGYDPSVTEATLKLIEAEEPTFKPQADQARQVTLEGGKPALKALIDRLRPQPKGPTVAETETARHNAATEAQAAVPKAQTLAEQLAAAIKAKDGPETRRLLNEQGRINAAGRAPTAAASKMWVVRDGQPVRVSEAEIRPGDKPSSTREQGRPVTSGDASDLADFDTSLDELSAVRAAIRPEDSTGIVARIGATIPYVTQITGWGSDAKKRQAVIDRVKQVIGKTLEGGVLRKEDEAKYEKILPNIGDAPDVAVSKLNGLDTAITKRKQRRLDNLSDANYDVSKQTTRGAPARPESGAIVVTAPDGSKHPFDTQAQADAFKKLAGL